MLAISLTLKLRTHTFGSPPPPSCRSRNLLSNSREGCDRLIKSTRPQTLFYLLCRAWASAYKHFKNSRESPSRFKKQTKTKQLEQERRRNRTVLKTSQGLSPLTRALKTITPLKQTTNHFQFFTIIMEVRQGCAASLAPCKNTWGHFHNSRQLFVWHNDIISFFIFFQSRQ